MKLTIIAFAALLAQQAFAQDTAQQFTGSLGGDFSAMAMVEDMLSCEFERRHYAINAGSGLFHTRSSDDDGYLTRAMRACCGFTETGYGFSRAYGRSAVDGELYRPARRLSLLDVYSPIPVGLLSARCHSSPARRSAHVYLRKTGLRASGRMDVSAFSGLPAAPAAGGQ